MNQPNDGGPDLSRFGTFFPSLLMAAFWCLVGWATTANKSKPYESQPESVAPRLYTVITHYGEYKDLKRSRSGEFETPQGKRIRLEEPHTEIEQ